MSKYKQAETVIETLKSLIDVIKNIQVDTSIIEDIQITIKELNTFFYHYPTLVFQRSYDLNTPDGFNSYINELETLTQTWVASINTRRTNSIDATFSEIYDFFRYVDSEVIYQMVIKHFLSLPKNIKDAYTTLNKSYLFLEHSINYLNNDFSLIRHLTELMTDKIENYKWLYEHLGDYRSKAILNQIISYWFSFDIPKLHSLNETIFTDYFDLDLIQCDENTVLVDLGAFNGDSVFNYINTYNKYKKIYAYEITPSTFKVLSDNFSNTPNVIPINKGVSNICGKMYVDGSDLFAANKLSDQGYTEIDVVTLDEDISEPISVIKMDIEGAEKDALLGATQHIKNDKPKLLISAYHIPADIFDIPELIQGIRDDYKFYLRYNGKNQIWSCDYVLFAL